MDVSEIYFNYKLYSAVKKINISDKRFFISSNTAVVSPYFIDVAQVVLQMLWTALQKINLMTLNRGTKSPVLHSAEYKQI